MTTDHTLIAIYRRLRERYGPQHWWPAESPFEVVVGAILTQAAAWRNVERAIAALKAADALSAPRLRALPEAELARLIYSAGYHNAKARKLRAFAAALAEFNDDLDRMLGGDLATVRRRLLAVHGVGPETADSILLYAAGRPSFVSDAYTRRIAARLGLVDERASYDELKRRFESALPLDAALFNEFHALLVQHGKAACRRTPRCDGRGLAAGEPKLAVASCCLADMCPTAVGVAATSSSPSSAV